MDTEYLLNLNYICCCCVFFIIIIKNFHHINCGINYKI